MQPRLDFRNYRNTFPFWESGKTHVDEDDTLKQGIVDNLGRKLNCQIDSAGQNRNVAEALRYINTSDAIATHVEDEDKMQIAFHDLKKYGLIGFGTKETQLINERADNAIRDHCKGVNETFIPTNRGKQLEKVIQKGQFTTLEIPNRGLPNLGNPKTQGHFNPEFGQRGTWLINESDLYSLMLINKFSLAKEFKNWQYV